MFKKLNFWGPIAVLLVALGFFLYAAFIETSFLSYPSLPLVTEIKSVKAGMIVPLKVDRCNSSDVEKEYLVTHTLKNVVTEQIYILKGVPASIKPGCSTNISMINLIPAMTTPGRYQIYGRSETKGFIKKFAVTWYSDVFEVTR